MKKIFFMSLAILIASAAFAQTTADEWFKKAGEYFDSGNYTNAVTAYSEAIKLSSSNLNAYWLRGVAYFQIKNYDAAIADCTTVINGVPDFSTAYTVRGDAYGAKGIYHKAVADFKKGLEKGGDPSTFNVDKSNRADMWFCGGMYMEIAVNRFLGNSAVVTKYENWLKTVCDKNNVTRTEVETFYRNNIRALISEVVDEEFNKIGFRIARHNAVLTRNLQTGQYILSYGGVNTNNETRTVTANSVEGLSREMRDGKKKADFTPADLDTVKAQAALIPAVALSDAALSDIKNYLTDFFITPNATTYNAVKEVYALYTNMRLSTGLESWERIRMACVAALAEFNEGLAQKVLTDVRASSAITTLTREQQQRLVGLR